VTGSQVEESEDFSSVEAEAGVAEVGISENGLKQFSFLLEHQVDAFFDGTAADELGNKYGVFLPNAVSPIDGLIFDGRVPPAVVEEDVAGDLQIQANSAHSVAHQQQV